MELKRQERFVGWYHSHPFDVGTHPCWFLSNTDLQTQNSYQIALPLWTALVIDPLRSIARQAPELGVFRVLGNNAPDSKTMPDGEFPPSEDFAVKRWHDSWKRYYCLPHTFFMSSASIKFLNIMSRNSLWIRVLADQRVLEAEYQEGVAKRVDTALKDLNHHQGDNSFEHPRPGRSHKANKAKAKDQGYEDPYQAATRSCGELASEQCMGHACNMAKQIIFNITRLEAARQQRQLSARGVARSSSPAPKAATAAEGRQQ